MNIDQYPINFGYGETTTLNGRPYTHRGNDYPLINQPVLINGTKIGISGATGLVSGPHVHVQAGRDEWAQQTIDPTPYVGKPGTVVKTSSASQWGNYVCVRVGGVNVFYCHLSTIDVQVGQVIGGEEMFNEGDRVNVCGSLYNSDPGQHKDVVGKPWKEAMYGILESAYYKQESRVNKGDVGNMSAVKDASGQKGKVWKQAAYDFLIPNQQKQDFVEAKVYVKKGE